jgi:hypothetical protein
MPDFGRRARKAALLFVAAVTTGCGLVVLFQLMPDQVRGVPTAILLGVVALLLLPGFTLAAMELDRRAAGPRPHRHAAGERPESGERHRRRLSSPERAERAPSVSERDLKDS